MASVGGYDCTGNACGYVQVVSSTANPNPTITVKNTHPSKTMSLMVTWVAGPLGGDIDQDEKIAAGESRKYTGPAGYEAAGVRRLWARINKPEEK